MPQNVLITGGAGYIGSILVPALLDKGYSITVLDLFPRGDTALALSCANPNFRPVKGDVRDEALVKELMAKADIIIPLAALVGAPLCKRDPLNAQTINSDAVRMLVKLSSKKQKILYPNTNSGYGIGEKTDFCTEESPLRPLSLYGTSKVEAESSILECGLWHVAPHAA
jgi:nucleoside-diphosphate-sugar epimerase